MWDMIVWLQEAGQRAKMRDYPAQCDHPTLDSLSPGLVRDR